MARPQAYILNQRRPDVMPRMSEIAHWWRVAWSFPPWSQAFWVGLLHDTVEDGYLPKALLKWPALDAVTRRDGETYGAFIERAAKHPVGRKVKLADLCDNLRRGVDSPRPSLRRRYLDAVEYLT